MELVRLLIALKGEVVVTRWRCVMVHLLLMLLIAESACFRQVVITRTSTHTSSVAIKGKVVGWRWHR